MLRTTLLLTIIALSLLTSACGKTLIVMQNPVDGQIVQCKGDAWNSWNVYAETEACAKAYESAGWKRIGGY